MKKIIILFLFYSLTIAQNKSVEERIDSVLALMTLDEKVGQLVQYSGGWDTGTQTVRPSEAHEKLIIMGKVGSFLNVFGTESTRRLQKIAVEQSRLKIPLIFGLDVIHGFRSIFPVPLAEACTWEPELVEQSARWQAIEAASTGLHWTFNPMVDIARDPRWGRIVEGSGEDPYLGSLMARARVLGYQGKKLSDNNSIVACAKHFAGYGGAEGGRDYNTVDISERTFREVFLKPFHAAVEAGVGTLMSSFNEIGGVPQSGCRFLLTDILRNEWGFKGFVVSDWNSVGELIPHGVAKNLEEAAQIGLEAGVDMDMEASAYYNHLADLVNRGKVSLDILNESVKRILRIKFYLGLFDDPFKYCDTDLEKKTILNKEIVNATREVAKRSVVLLKNENYLLPLSKEISKIAVLGPLANSKDDPLGPWAAQGKPEDVVTVVEGLKNKLGNRTEIIYEEGCKIDGNSKEGFSKAVEAAKNADVVIMCVGESRGMSAEARSRAYLDLPGVQEDFVKEIHKTGKPIVVVLMNGRPLTINWINENISSILETWFLGIQSGNAIADILFGDYNPSGKLTTTFPRYVGQVPIYYNHKMTGRPYDKSNFYTSYYLDLENSPLYPFGYGLSYTTFKYSDLTLSQNKMNINESITVSVNVTNSGKYEGEEVVQLYIRDLVGSVTRPVKELKDFKKILLKPGETKNVEFLITEDKLKFYDINMDYVSEPGDFKVFVGTNSEEVLESSFMLIK
ncbi:MAG: beta-glucosidase BglX [Melioribacteraceae bacterium]|nr:beta-glucosidase BglX [Melioribacteraceae bacterium]